MSMSSSARQGLRVMYRHSPDGVRRAIRVRRHAKLWNDAGILFIHVPKCAGTSISEAIYGRFTNHVRAEDVDRWGEAGVKALPSFAVTRNPWDRLVSAYRFAVRGHGEGGDFVVETWRPEQYRKAAFLTFERFVEEWLAVQQLAKLDPIFQPQKQFVCNRVGDILVNHTGKIENLCATATWIEETTGVEPSFPHHNRSGAPVKYRDFYSGRLMNMVGEIYRDDVEAFNYDF